MPQITAGFFLQIAYNVFYFLVSKAIKATGNVQFQTDFDAVCTSIETMFKNLK